VAEAGSLIHGLGLVPATLLGGAQVPAGHPLPPAELTILTAAFVHGSWLHLIGNMLFLWVFGDNAEDAMRHVRFALFYVLCAIAGVLGAYLVLHPRMKIVALLLRRVPVLLPAYLLIGAWLLVQLFSIWWGSNDPIAWWAYIGGFVAGALLVVPLRDKRVALFDGGLRRQ
jgi:membrane associated rhomboid family serine protease